MITTNYTSEKWQAFAQCAASSANKDIFFSEEIHEIAEAKQICASCEVISPCLQGALERNEPCGVWGGQLFINGKILSVKRRRADPQKCHAQKNKCQQYLFLSTFKHFSKQLKALPLSIRSKQRLKRASTKSLFPVHITYREQVRDVSHMGYNYLKEQFKR